METDALRVLNRATLARQLLLAREKTTPLKAIERLVAMQAQVARPPFIGLWTRLETFEAIDLAKLFRNKEAVRVTALRATLHVMSARDYLAFRGAFQPMFDKGRQSILGPRLATVDIAALEKRARKFFAKPAPFDSFRDHLLAEDPKCDARALAYACRLRVPLVQVPTDDPWAFPAAAGFQVADTWLGKPVSAKATPPDELVLRYLAAFGPATPADAQAWSGLQGLKEVFERLRPKLVTIQVGKREYFDLPKASRPDPGVEAPVRFLPDFDNLLLGHQDRSRIVADAHRPKVVSKNLLVAATFLVDGFVAGTWKAAATKKQATLQLTPFGKLDGAARASLEAEGERLLQFLFPEVPAKTIAVR